MNEGEDRLRRTHVKYWCPCGCGRSMVWDHQKRIIGETPKDPVKWRKAFKAVFVCVRCGLSAYNSSPCVKPGARVLKIIKRGDRPLLPRSVRVW